MNGLILNYVLLFLFIGVIVREVLFIKQKNVIRIGRIAFAVIATLMALYSIIKGIPINDLKLMIEKGFNK